MERIAEFEKVSFEQYMEALRKADPQRSEQEIRRIYDAIRLPRRATEGSAGYDFFAPEDLVLSPGAQALVPTGIRARIDSGDVLMLFPRSGLGFKYRLQLNNTAGVIDSDYYNAVNEGHIFCKLTNDTRDGKTVEIHAGEGLVQGIFIPFGITVDDDTHAQRTGGFGSTTGK